MNSISSSTPLPRLDYRWIFLASLLVSAWLIVWDPLINRDAIIYLRSADAYLQHGFAASQQEHGRPLLSICMALLHQLSGLPLLYCGLSIITLAYAVMCVGFVATIHTLGGDRRVQLIAALVVLSHPLLNHTRSSIMRDPIYWALVILSFRELLQYARQPVLKHQLRWSACIAGASLFRFEGLFFATLVPLSLLFARDLEHRARHCVRLIVPVLVAIAAAVLAILAYKQSLGEGSKLFPAIAQYIDNLLDFPEDFAAIAARSAEPMLRLSSREDAGIAVFAGLTAVLLINICRAMTWPWIGTLWWGFKAQLLGRFRANDSLLLKTHIGISFAYLALFILINRFMLERYGNQLVIFLLLYIPFVLSALWHAGGWKKYLVIALLVGMSADSLHNGDRDKVFIREATDWIRMHTPPDSTLVSNEKYIAHFSARPVNWPALNAVHFDLQEIIAAPRLWRHSNFLAVYLRPRHYQAWAAFLESNGLAEHRVFAGERKGKVSIVVVNPPAHPAVGPAPDPG